MGDFMQDKTIKLYYNELEFGISGYERYRKVEDDSWANVILKVCNDTIKFENCSFDIMSCEVDELRDRISEFLNKKMKNYACYKPTEEAFKVRFYPKGDEYGIYYEGLNSKKLLESPNIEILVYPTDKIGALDTVGVSFILEEDDIKRLYKYLIEITK